MKLLLLFAFFFCANGQSYISTGLTETAGSNRAKSIVGDIERSGENDERIKILGNRYGILLEENEEDVTNECNFVRPCKLDDLDCIREFFKDNSNCRIAEGPASDPLFLAQNTVFFQYTNMSLTLTDLEVRGLSESKIIEFYYNKVTKNVVFAFEVPTLNEMSPNTYITYHRTAKESIVKADFLTAEYYGNQYTVTIPKIPKLRLDLAEVHAFLPDLPNFEIGPNASESQDPDVIEGFQSLLESVPILVREDFLLKAQLLAAVYIQENICDFRLKLYSL